MTSIGFKKTFNLIRKYPQLIIIPAFTSFTFGPVKFHNDSNLRCNGCFGNKIIVSYRYSWMNFILNGLIYFVIGYVTVENYCDNSLENCLKVVPKNMVFQSMWYYKFVLPILGPFFLLFGIFPLILLPFLDRCTSCCNKYNFCNNYILPFTKRTILDIENKETSEIVFLDNYK